MISIVEKSGKGRCQISNQRISSDTLIMGTKSFGQSIAENHKKRICAYCLDQSEKIFDLYCKECQLVYYCSLDCLRNGCSIYRGNHVSICAGMKKISSLKESKELKSVLQLMLAIASQKSVEERKANVKSMCSSIIIDLINEALSGLNISKPLIEENTIFSIVKSLESHYTKWDKEMIQDWKKPVVLFESILQSLSLSLDDLKTYDLLSIIESNSFGIYYKKDIVGRALYPMASFFNHSCFPNCEAVRSLNQMQIITKQEIEEQQELTISYIDTMLPSSTRQFQLKSNYFFQCQCEKCLSNDLKITYQKSVKTKKKQKPVALLDTHKKDKKMIISDRAEES